VTSAGSSSVSYSRMPTAEDSRRVGSDVTAEQEAGFTVASSCRALNLPLLSDAGSNRIV
jgi:hypothetical protein